MGRLRVVVPFGEGSEVAARQAGALFALAGLLALVGMATTPGEAGVLLWVAVADLLVAAGTWWTPWARLHRRAPMILSVPAFAILAVSTWAAGGVATGTGPFFVLIFAWAGLHFPPWSLFAMVPLGLLAYVTPLVLTHQPPPVVGSAVVLIPVCVGVGLVICQQAAYQRRARDELRRIEQWRAAMMATLAHDVRSPLTSVQIVLECLRDYPADLPPAHRDQMIGAALRQTSRIRRLAAGLLDVHRAEVLGQLQLDLASVPLRTAVQDAVTDINAEAVTVDVPIGLAVLADPDRLEQILVNLITNALRYGRPPVIVHASRHGPQVRLAVRDHGPGVPDEHRERLFDRFGAASGAGGSVGLGLWIVRELACAHGGDVAYAPAWPGAEFSVTLPVATAATPVGPPVAVRP